MNIKIHRGEIYYAKLFGTLGSEENGYRPVVIVQNDIGNKFANTVIIVPLTRKIDINNRQPTHVFLKAFGNIKYNSMILAEQVRTIDKSRLCRKVDILPRDIMQKVDDAMKIAQGINK